MYHTLHHTVMSICYTLQRLLVDLKRLKYILMRKTDFLSLRFSYRCTCKLTVTCFLIGARGFQMFNIDGDIYPIKYVCEFPTPGNLNL